jgi:hypothetical protein
MGNPFVHVELQTQDLGKAKKFYQGLFDWKLEDVPGIPPMGYTMVHVGEGTGGGMMKCPVSGAPSQWLPYILVDDVKASTKKAKGLGAKVVQDVTEVPNYGWLSVISDPTGAAVGLWQVKDGK